MRRSAASHHLTPRALQGDARLFRSVGVKTPRRNRLHEAIGIIRRSEQSTLCRGRHNIDLLFYHRFLRALVAIELKVGAFEPEFAGKMDFYLNLLNERERGAGDEPSIGIILCAQKESLAVEFSLKSKTNPIGVAEYQLQSTLPTNMQGKLPTPRQFDDVVRSLLPGPIRRVLRSD